MGKLRIRFTLKELALLFIFVGMAAAIFVQWRELVPLRAEVRQMRSELGMLTIDDAERIHAVEVRQSDPRLWRWRMYLPEGRRYTVREFGGKLPPRGNLSNRQWLAAMRSAQVGISSGEFSSAGLAGELTIEASLEPVEGRWRFAMHPGVGASDYTFTDDWLTKSRIQRSDVLQDTQRVYPSGEPILLLYLSKPIRTPTPGGGFSISEPTVVEEGIALWLE